MAKKIILLFFILILGVLIGIFLTNTNRQSQGKSRCSLQYKFLNKQLGCQDPYVIKKHDYKVLKSTLVDFIDSTINQNQARIISVYFRDLYDGPIFAIDQDSDFAPASLLKVPLAIAFLAIAEDNKNFLKQKIEYNRDMDVRGQNLSPDRTLEKDKSYSIEELIHKMIAYSDNRSYLLLEDYAKKFSTQKNPLLDTYQQLGIVEPNSTLDDTITVKSYASIFRNLYHASYLSKEMSNKLLSFLAESEFVEGLEAGVPKEVTVAHKFGERIVLPANKVQIHDCGIIYYPGNPYLLCIMTRGDNTDELKTIIASISKMVYQEVDSRKIR